MGEIINSRRPNGDLVRSQTKMATLINEHFKIPCTKQLIQDWQRRWEPPFPAHNAMGCYSRSACFEWVETVYLPKRGSKVQQDLLLTGENAKQELVILKAKREKFELEREQGLFIARTQHERSLNGAIKTYHAFVRRAAETYLPESRRDKLIQLGAAQEIIALFHEFDLKSSQAIIDNIEAQCAKVTDDEITETNDLAK